MIREKLYRKYNSFSSRDAFHSRVTGKMVVMVMMVMMMMMMMMMMMISIKASRAQGSETTSYLARRARFTLAENNYAKSSFI